MGAFLSAFITPVLVSLFISLWANSVLEERRARRDHITKLFESARDDIRRAIEAGVDYFVVAPGTRTPLQEAKVLSADRELRAAIALLLVRDRSDTCAVTTGAARKAFETLLLELTGGTFQAKDGDISREHITRLVHAGANMRTALARLRDAELKDRFEQDPIMPAVLKCVTSFRIFVRANWPFRRNG